MEWCRGSYTETWPPSDDRSGGICPVCGAKVKVIDQGERGVIPKHKAKKP